MVSQTSKLILWKILRFPRHPLVDVYDDGGAAITERGVCWNTAGSPTLNDNSSFDSQGQNIGLINVNITDLERSSRYFVRSFATNSVGTFYGNEVAFQTYYDSIVDVDGNWYLTLKIGTQLWMAENLKTTKLNDGIDIESVSTAPGYWQTVIDPGYRWPSNRVAFKEKFGGLYNGYTVESNKVCPSGWHVPSDGEGTTLTDFMGGSEVAGAKLKSSGDEWFTQLRGTNESGFTGYQAGYISYEGSPFSFGYLGIWWSSTKSPNNGYWYRSLDSTKDSIIRKEFELVGGLSIRCIAD